MNVRRLINAVDIKIKYIRKDLMLKKERKLKLRMILL